MSMWYRQPKITDFALKPLGWPYAAAVRLRRLFTTPYKASIPVICVGNVVVGGAGKTPTVIAVAEQYKSHGRNVHILSRGYQATLQGPIQVDPQQHEYTDVGDEPLLLSEIAPTWICRNKVAGVKAIEQAGADMIIMDDGLQNPTVYKDTTYLVIDSKQGLGNGMGLPAGPLRESLSQVLNQADQVIIVGNGKFQDLIPDSKPQIHATVVPEQKSLQEFKQSPVVAFAGLGYPQKFFETLKESGIEVINTITFPDHHPYQDREIISLLEKAKPANALLVTTSKDYVRIPKQLRKQVKVFSIKLDFKGVVINESG